MVAPEISYFCVPTGDSVIRDAGYFVTPFLSATLPLTAIFLPPFAALPLHFLICGFPLPPIHLLNFPHRDCVAVGYVIPQQYHVAVGVGMGEILGASLVKSTGVTKMVRTIAGEMTTAVAALVGLHVHRCGVLAVSGTVWVPPPWWQLE